MKSIDAPPENGLPAPLEMPPGDHPIEVAARAGFGPMSPAAGDVWHGQAVPCVSCGQLVRRNQKTCDHCEQDLSEEMVAKMRAYAGPWYVLEHVRPFPGVTFERIVRQIHRGLLTATAIVRGPTTDHQWRFAVETPGLSRYFGRCWKCHHVVTLSDIYCASCRAYQLAEALVLARPAPAALAAEMARTIEVRGDANRMLQDNLLDGNQIDHIPVDSDGLDPALPESAEFLALREALEATPGLQRTEGPNEPPRIGRVRATWLVAAMVALVMIALSILVQVRRSATQQPSPAPPTSAATPQSK